VNGEHKDTHEMSNPLEEAPVLPGIGPAVSEDRIVRVISWVTKCAVKQNGLVKNYNLTHFLCPPLDLKPTGTNHESDIVTRF